MKTYQDFLDAGLDENVDDIVLKQMNGYEEIVEFAWRDNYGKPEFKGVIEYKFNGELQVDFADTSQMGEYDWMECPVSGRITQWRPLVNQPESAKTTVGYDEVADIIVKSVAEARRSAVYAAIEACKMHTSATGEVVLVSDLKRYADSLASGIIEGGKPTEGASVMGSPDKPTKPPTKPPVKPK